jgi:hypothetical protein
MIGAMEKVPRSIYKAFVTISGMLLYDFET